MKKLLCFILLIFVLNSCSSIKKSNSHGFISEDLVKIIPDQLDLPMDSQGKEKPATTISQEETVRVGDRGGDIYSNTEERDYHARFKNRKLIIGLSLGPGMYRTINYVSFFKVLERNNLSVNIITGTGFGAIVAAMYASGMTPEAIEWLFYKYFKEKNKNKLYDPDWIAEVDEAFLRKIKIVNIQETKIKFFITLYDYKKNRTYYFDKGNIRDLLLLNLKLLSALPKSENPERYSAAFEKEVFNSPLLKRLGAEFTIAVDSLGSKFDFLNANEFLIGIYGRVAGRIQNERKKFDYSVTLPLNAMNLESTKDGPLYLQKSYEFMRKESPIILKKIQAKIESLENSGNE